MRDINRTFPEHPYFGQENRGGQAALFRLLKAYSLQDIEVRAHVCVRARTCARVCVRARACVLMCACERMFAHTFVLSLSTLDCFRGTCKHACVSCCR